MGSVCGERRFDLIAAQLQQRRFQAALEVLSTLDPAAASDTLLRDWRGIAEVGIGKTEAGLADLRAAAAAAPDQPEYPFNLAAILRRSGDDAGALPLLTRAVTLRPNFAAKAPPARPSAGAGWPRWPCHRE